MKTTVLQERTALAIGWSGIRPGNVIAVREERTHVENFPKSPETVTLYRFRAEFEDEDMGALIRKALEWQRKYSAQFVYARNHEPAMRFLEVFNRSAWRARTPLLTVTEPPYSSDQGTGVKGNIDYHLARLREYLQPGREKLFDLPGTKVKAYLEDVPPDAVNLKDRDWPGPAALAYAVCGLELSAGYEEEERLAEMLLEEEAWDD